MVRRFLVLGGARSGKSRRALDLALQIGAKPVFVATAEPLDDEMADRIARHQDERGAEWSTIEAPLDLVAAIEAASQTGSVCLIDCLTLWLYNLMHHERDVVTETGRLARFVTGAPISTIFVSNEVGMGLVPDTQLGRTFRDEQGRLNQTLASVCDQVEFVAAGLPIKLKG